jgi:hypothetical protein
MSKTVYGAAESYECEAQDYVTQQTGQLTMFDMLGPSEETIFEDKVAPHLIVELARVASRVVRYGN